MLNLLIALSRFLLSAWVGGAALFVVTSVAEQRSPDFGSVIRDQLATIRFPLYYVFALGTLVPATVLLGMAMVSRRARSSWLLLTTFGLSTLSCIVAVVDYLFVYQPLQELIIPAGKARDLRFVELHEQSRWINEVHVGLALLAALMICLVVLPATQEKQ